MPELRVATFNISGGIHADRRFYRKRGSAECGKRADSARETLAAMSQMLRAESVDIVALQEVDVCYSAEATFDQAAYLGDALESEVAYQPLFDYHLGKQVNVTTGLATASRPPILAERPLHFPQPYGSWKRRLKSRLLGSKGALHTTHLVDGTKIHVVNAHLSHDVDAQKELEFELLLRYCSRLDPVVLLGDLNTTPMATRNLEMVEANHFASDECMSILAWYQREFAGRIHLDTRFPCTYPEDAPSIKLDYCIAFASDPNFSISRELVLPAARSNHLATAISLHW